MSSSTFNNAPLYVLLAIFKELPRYNLNECQFVCKSWHKAANLLLLQDPRFLDNTQANKFLEYIKQHPSKRAEIKKLTLKGSPASYDDKRYLTLDEDLCKSIVDNFPNVEKVVISTRNDPPSEAYYKLLFDLRNSLTDVCIQRGYSEERFGHHADYLAQFPKLLSVSIYESGVYGVERFFPLLLNNPHLKELHTSIEIFSDDETLKAQSEEDQKIIVERLGQLETFDVVADPNVEMVKFIKKYFTGLKKLRVVGCFDPDENERDDYSLPSLTTFTEYACTLLEHVFEVGYIYKTVIYGRLPGIMQNLYYTLPRNIYKAHRMLCIKTEEEECNTMPRRMCPFNIATSSEIHDGVLTRTVGLDFVLYPYNRVEFKEALGLDLPLQDVDILKFRIKDREPPNRTFTMFRDLLFKMPAVTKVIIEIPEDIFEKYKGYQKKTHPNVTDLEIISWTRDTDGKQKLIGVVSMFPNAKKLKLTGFCGICTVWEREQRSEYNATLDKTELETLSIDVGRLEHDPNLQSEHYFMLAVEVKDRRVKRFYKVWNEYLRLEEIQEREFKQSNVSKVEVKIKKVKCLTIFRKRVISNKTEDLIETNISF